MSLVVSPKALELFNRCRKPVPKLSNAVPASLYVYDFIGEGGVSPASIAEDLKAASTARKLTVYVNSPGGDYFAGKAIYSQLSRFAETHEVEAIVDGLAASAASFILMAAQTITMSEGSTLMVHEVQGGAMGRASDLEEKAALIREETKQLASIYQKRTGLSEDRILSLLAAETFMTAKEAVDLHFADRIYGDNLDNRVFDLRITALQASLRRTGPARKTKP